MSGPSIGKFPGIRGMQAGKEYFVVMMPFSLVSKLLLFDDQSLPPEHRQQRVINKARIPIIRDYILNNPDDYVFSAITASVDKPISFIPASSDGQLYSVGVMEIPLTARIVINDGQHRKAAIEEALKIRPELSDEDIPCVMFYDRGLKRSQQMFTDLNRYAIRTTQSLNVLYDHNDPIAVLVKKVITQIPMLDGLVEVEKSSLPNRSIRLFTLSGFYNATRELLRYRQSEIKTSLEHQSLVLSFWETVTTLIPEWKKVKEGCISAAECRRDFIHSHSVALLALGALGRAILLQRDSCWEKHMSPLGALDWSKKNIALWEGRALIGGRVSISRNNHVLVTNALKLSLGLKLSEQEQDAEASFVNARIL